MKSDWEQAAKTGDTSSLEAQISARPYLVLGFDAREKWLPPGSGWDESRRQSYLYRPDVEKPLSVDSIVWRSVFDLHPALRPRFIGIFHVLFEDLEHLERLLDTAAAELGPCDLVALALDLAACNEEEQAKLDHFLTGTNSGGTPASGPLTTLAKPVAIDDGWKFLGYDVADLGCLSGLMNMGFLSDYDDVEALRARWGPQLNAFHLFDDPEPAEEFKSFSDQRVKEHAPFYVIGIWRVRTWP